MSGVDDPVLEAVRTLTRRRTTGREDASAYEHPDRCLPYPEIAETDGHNDPYEIVDSCEQPGLSTDGAVSKAQRVLYVPLHPGGRGVSRHELAHVRWSPLSWPRVRYDPNVLAAVEDARINLGLDAIGLPMALTPSQHQRVRTLAIRDLERENAGMYVLRCLAGIGTDVEGEILGAASDVDGVRATRMLAERLHEKVRSRLVRGRRRARSAVTSFEHVKTIAREVAKELEREGLIEPGARRRSAVCCIAAAGIGPTHRGRRGGRLHLVGSGTGRPGRMEIVTAPLTLETPPAACRGGRRRWRPATEGSVVRWIHRYPIDRAIFRRTERRLGGTVLIDVSGSMSLAESDVRRIVVAAGGPTTVAIYSGDGNAGELRIVARDGRMAAPRELRPFGIGNIVDLPALQWLARQAPSRIWVSDGGVTGIGDFSSSCLERRCRSLCAEARIERVGNVDEAEHRLQHG